MHAHYHPSHLGEDLLNSAGQDELISIWQWNWSAYLILLKIAPIDSNHTSKKIQQLIATTPWRLVPITGHNGDCKGVIQTGIEWKMYWHACKRPPDLARKNPDGR